jgi:putative transposase
MSVEEKREIIEPQHREISIRRQCELLKLNRSNRYYEPVKVSGETFRIMGRIDEIFYRESILWESADKGRLRT